MIWNDVLTQNQKSKEDGPMCHLKLSTSNINICWNLKFLIQLVHVKRVFVTKAKREESGKAVHPCGMARAFAVRSHNILYLKEASDKKMKL